MAADSVSTNWRPLAVGVYQDGHLAVGVEFAEGQLLLFALPDVHRFEIVFKPELFKSDGDANAVGRRKRIDVDHGSILGLS